MDYPRSSWIYTSDQLYSRPPQDCRDDVVNLLTRNIYLVVVSVSTQLRSNVFIKQIILIKIPRHWAK